MCKTQTFPLPDSRFEVPNSLLKTEHPVAVRITAVWVVNIGVFLQHRWEDADGNIFAYRVGTASEHITKSVSEWKNNYRVPIRYGDITKTPNHKSWEKLSKDRFMARNSKGKMVPVQEIGYKADATPTHLILQISAGCQEAFTGCPGNVVWVDNIRLVY